MQAMSFLLVVAMGLAFQMDPRSKAAEHVEQSVQINELAGHLNSEADSSELVDQLAAMFKDELPPAWATASLRQHLAKAEFKSATDASSLIPEQRVADAWNRYVRAIGAPDETVVTVAEIHNLRDAEYASGKALWNRNVNRTVWTIPNIVALGTDGKVANGCRALEAIRVLESMRLIFENVRGARKRVQEGVLVSDQLAKAAGAESSPSQFKARLVAAASTNPIGPAEQHYVQQHGQAAFNRSLADMYFQLFSDRQL